MRTSAAEKEKLYKIQCEENRDWLICGRVSQLKEDVAKGLEGFASNKQGAWGQ